MHLELCLVGLNVFLINRNFVYITQLVFALVENVFSSLCAADYHVNGLQPLWTKNRIGFILDGKDKKVT